jgi:ABC-type multidrug transport system fused ATPase/permease subunit
MLRRLILFGNYPATRTPSWVSAARDFRGGERQRLAIARALLRDTEALILDEAASALDRGSERRVQRSLERLHGNVTLIVIAHQLATTTSADSIVVLDRGRVVEPRAVEDLRRNAESFLAGCELVND